MQTKLDDSGFRRSVDMIAGVEIENGSFDHDHAPFIGWFVIQKLGFDTVYLCAKFDDSSISCSRYITGAP